MKWILVYIVVQPFVEGDTSSYEPYAINPLGPRVLFDDMYDCFDARDHLSKTVGIGQGYFGPGQQAVCIPLENIEI